MKLEIPSSIFFSEQIHRGMNLDPMPAEDSVKLGRHVRLVWLWSVECALRENVAQSFGNYFRIAATTISNES